MKASPQLVMAQQKISGMSQQELTIDTGEPNFSRLESAQQDVAINLQVKTALPACRYSLRLYDEELLTFSMEDAGLSGMQTTIRSVSEKRRDVFPLDLEVTNEGIFSWLQRRVIPRNRVFADAILKTLGLSINNTKGIIDICKGLSLNDSYWVVPEGFGGTFKDYNLYDNRFSTALSHIAFTGIGHCNSVNMISPELTTHGMLRKAWRFVEGKGMYLYKGGTEGAANTGNEPYSEYYAFQIAKRM